VDSESFERSLVAILMGDLAGFTGDVAEDDVAALRLAREFRGFVKRVVADHGGRVVDDLGDGFLAEFGSAFAAARCGIALQHAIAKRNESAEKRMQLLLSLCLGEVLRDGSRILGASVNLAFHLLRDCDVGGLVASVHAAEQLEQTSAFELDALGVRRIAALPKPVAVYRVRTGVEIPDARRARDRREAHGRRLAAILHADVESWSHLMATKEAATVEAITRYREGMASHVERRNGNVVDTRADNLLAEFPSVLDAVLCAIEIQRDLASRNEEREPDARLAFRMGIHLGDVRVEGDRIYGSVLNIAARLEALAESGGICLSSVVHEQVRYHLDVPFEDLGERELKNIPYPVHVWRIGPAGA
jgi:class 3 adenylate cyclase